VGAGGGDAAAGDRQGCGAGGQTSFAVGTLSLSGGRAMHGWCFPVLDAKVRNFQYALIIGLESMATFCANEFAA
jgi:hypothetical protein